jgi:hypothetical protein
MGILGLVADERVAALRFTDDDGPRSQINDQVNSGPFSVDRLDQNQLE